MYLGESGSHNFSPFYKTYFVEITFNLVTLRKPLLNILKFTLKHKFSIHLFQIFRWYIKILIYVIIKYLLL